MKRVYTTANGKRINLDAVIAQNESTIAVGNMKVNARGDELGPGGRIERTKDKIIADYYKLNTPVATDGMPQPNKKEVNKDLTDDWIEPINQTADESQLALDSTEEQPQLRGRLADSISKNKVPEKEVPKKTGPSRI